MYYHYVRFSPCTLFYVAMTTSVPVSSTDPVPDSHTGSQVGLAVGLSLGVCVPVIILLVIIILYQRRIIVSTRNEHST
jgi:hypothetical protein